MEATAHAIRRRPQEQSSEEEEDEKSSHSSENNSWSIHRRLRTQEDEKAHANQPALSPEDKYQKCYIMASNVATTASRWWKDVVFGFFRVNGPDGMPEVVQHLCLLFYWLDFRFTDRPRVTDYEQKHYFADYDYDDSPFNRGCVRSIAPIGKLTEGIVKYEWKFRMESDIAFKRKGARITVGIEAVHGEYEADSSGWDAEEYFELSYEYAALVIRQNKVVFENSVGSIHDYKSHKFQVKKGDTVTITLEPMNLSEKQIDFCLYRDDVKQLQHKMSHTRVPENAYLALETAEGGHPIELIEWTIGQKSRKKKRKRTKKSRKEIKAIYDRLRSS